MFKFRRGSLFNEHTNGLEVLKPSRKLPELLDHTLARNTQAQIEVGLDIAGVDSQRFFVGIEGFLPAALSREGKALLEELIAFLKLSIQVRRHGKQFTPIQAGLQNLEFGRCGDGYGYGRSTMNVAPLPSPELSARTDPPCRSTM